MSPNSILLVTELDFGVNVTGFTEENLAMAPREIVFLVFGLIGGIALFMFGMSLLSEGLRMAAGRKLREVLAKTTQDRFRGITLGTLLGFLGHSGPTTVMLVGFINAGLMTLAESIPPMMGSNFGTSLSMQMFSFKLGEYCYAAIGLGFIIHFAFSNPVIKNSGRALMGFGLLFLGMNTLSATIEPHRDLIAPWLAHVHGTTMTGMLTGIALSTLVTAIVQSSGAVIGMCFVLSSTHVFTSLEQVYPIVLGAHIGTCITALLCSIGTNVEARRSAFSHLTFNIIGTILAVALAPLYIKFLTWTSSDLVHQIANLHMTVMLVTSLALLPVTPFFAKFMKVIVPSRKPVPQPSYLDGKLLPFPEKAILAAICELRRVTIICAQSLHLTSKVFFRPERRTVQVVKLNEGIVDEIKLAMKDYLAQLTSRTLSRRQAILIQHISRCMTDIERIGDHIDEICDISIRRWKNKQARFDHATLELIISLFEAADSVLHEVIESLNPDNQNFQATAEGVLKARDEYMQKSLNAKAMFMDKIAQHEYPPILGMFFSEYAAALDRVVKHSKTIALVQKQPYFWIKRKKLNRLAEEAPEYIPPPPSEADDFLDRLQAEDHQI